MEWSPIQKAATLFIAVLFLTSFAGIDRWNSFLGTQPYFQGWILYAYFFLFFLLVSQSRIKLERWAYILTGSATIVAFLAIGQWVQVNLLGHNLPTYAGRVVSTFGQPNFYSGFILLILPFHYFLLKRHTRGGFLVMVGFLISIMAVILSQSRVAFLMLGGLTVIFLISQFHSPIKRLVTLTLALAIFLISLLVSASLWSGFFAKEVIEPIFVKDPDLTELSVENRIYIWPVAWQLILQKPTTGYGLENISFAFADYFTTNKHTLFEETLNISPVLISLKELNIDRSHNYTLDLLMFSGILGLLAWIILVFLLIKQIVLSSVKPDNTVLLIGLFTYLVWIQFQNQSVVHLIYFWLLLGLIDRD